MPYTPPRLTQKIRIRNPADEPARERDRFGAPIGPEPVYGVVVWAHRRDQSAFTEIGESVQVRAGRTVFTIRKRDGIRADDEIVDSDGIVFTLTGSPVEKGPSSTHIGSQILPAVLFAERCRFMIKWIKR